MSNQSSPYRASAENFSLPQEKKHLIVVQFSEEKDLGSSAFLTFLGYLVLGFLLGVFYTSEHIDAKLQKHIDSLQNDTEVSPTCFVDDAGQMDAPPSTEE